MVSDTAESTAKHLPQSGSEPLPWPSLSPTTQEVALENGRGAQTSVQEQPGVPTEAEISFIHFCLFVQVLFFFFLKHILLAEGGRCCSSFGLFKTLWSREAESLEARGREKSDPLSWVLLKCKNKPSKAGPWR